MVACPWDPPNWTSCSKITYCDFSSSDGITWTKGALRLFTGLNSSVPSLTYCNGFFFILGDAGTILTSPNGTTWTKQNSNTVSILRSVTYGDGQFVVVGTTILTSRDGRAWEEISNGDEQNFGLLNSVAYGNGQFVAVSRNLYFSPDGKNWTKKDLNILYGFNSIVFADSQFIAVGDIGMIIGSGDGAKWSLYYLLGKNQQTPTAISLQNPQGDSKYKSTKKNNAIIAKIKIANKVFSSRLPLSFARGPFSAELFNSMGKRIFSSSATVFDQTMNISIYRVPTGVYFMSIKDVNNNGFSTRLFITK
jgi:hypothetical protein